jgi:hypothetical protein
MNTPPPPFEVAAQHGNAVVQRRAVPYADAGGAPARTEVAA